MSIKALAWVWEHSQARGADLLTLLAIADSYNDDEGCARPSVSLIAAKARTSPRTVHRHLAHLVSTRELAVEERQRDNGSRTASRYYLVNLPCQSVRGAPDKMADQPCQSVRGAPDTADRGPLTTVSDPDPKKIHTPPKGGGRSSARPRAPRARDAILDTLARVEGCQDLSKVPRSLWASLATAKRDLLEVEPEVSATEVWKRGQRMRRAWGDKCSAHALVKHWHRFGAEAEDGQPISYGGGER